MKKNTIKRLGIFAVLILIGVLCAGCDETGYTTLRGIYVESALGDDVIVLDADHTAEYVFLNDKSQDMKLFDGLDTGDQIEIKLVLVEEMDGVSWTDVFACRKVGTSSQALEETHLEAINSMAQSMRTE